MTLKDAVLGLVGSVEDAVAEEREQCCRDICGPCCGTVPAQRDTRLRMPFIGVWFHHTVDDAGRVYHQVCAAEKIRERHYQQQEGEK